MNHDKIYLALFILLNLLLWSCESKKNELSSEVITPQTKAIIPQQNTIDSLKTDKDVLQFLDRFDIYPNKHRILGVSPFTCYYRCKGIYDSLPTQKYFKADFDKNGYTDIGVLYGEGNPNINYRYSGSTTRFMIILGEKDNKFKMSPYYNLEFPQKNDACCSFFTFDNLLLLENKGLDFELKAQPIIYYHYIPQEYCWDKKDISKVRYTKDTLVFKFGSLIEYNPKPEKKKIKQIKLEVTYNNIWDCFGEEPVFKATFTKDSTFYQEGYYDKAKQIKIKNNDAEEYEELCNILNYLVDFPLPIKRRYLLDEDFDYIRNIEITYEDGQKKLIQNHHDTHSFNLFGLELFMNKVLYDSFGRKFITN